MLLLKLCLFRGGILTGFWSSGCLYFAFVFIMHLINFFLFLVSISIPLTSDQMTERVNSACWERVQGFSHRVIRIQLILHYLLMCVRLTRALSTTMVCRIVLELRQYAEQRTVTETYERTPVFTSTNAFGEFFEVDADTLHPRTTFTTCRNLQYTDREDLDLEAI